MKGSASSIILWYHLPCCPLPTLPDSAGCYSGSRSLATTLGLALAVTLPLILVLAFPLTLALALPNVD